MKKLYCDVCANKNYKSSWPEFKGSCPYLEQISKQSKERTNGK